MHYTAYFDVCGAVQAVQARPSNVHAPPVPLPLPLPLPLRSSSGHWCTRAGAGWYDWKCASQSRAEQGRAEECSAVPGLTHEWRRLTNLYALHVSTYTAAKDAKSVQGTFSGRVFAPVKSLLSFSLKRKVNVKKSIAKVVFFSSLKQEMQVCRF